MGEGMVRLGLGQGKGEGWWCRPRPNPGRKEREGEEEKERGRLSLLFVSRPKPKRKEKGAGVMREGAMPCACAKVWPKCMCTSVGVKKRKKWSGGVVDGVTLGELVVVM
jgi:hypothetical protein